MPQPPFFSKALITGGHSGLGKALSDFLETQHIQVIRTSSQTHDLATEEGLETLLSLITEEKPDLIINNAGIGLYGPALSHPLEDQMRILEINIKALAKITLHGAKTMERGTILNISSAGGFFVYPTFALYCASKAFVNYFSQALDQELKPDGIRILCACPGQIATPFRIHASKGHLQKKTDRHTMSIEQAVAHLWWQLQKQKTLYIFDWRTRWMVLASKLIPHFLLNYLLTKGLKRRYL